ncbi:MAG: 23S rRNA (uracil(1939)-C(5))-methyltransferase RlmD [Halanaerobiaceae bacterium]
MVTVEVGGEYLLKVEKIVYGGEGLARPEAGPVVFIKNVLPGETVRARITERKGSMARAELIEVVAEADCRIEPDCPVFYECGGCQLQHGDYQAQLGFKKSIIEESFERIGKLKEWPDFEVLGMDFPWYYRNKGQFPVGERDDELITGFYQAGSHEIIEFPECKIQHQPINRLLDKVLDFFKEQGIKAYDEKRDQGILRHFLIRSGLCTGQLQLTVVVRNSLSAKVLAELKEFIAEEQALVSIYQNINSEKTNRILGEVSELIAGEEYILDYLGRNKYSIYPESFFQVNTVQTERLYGVIGDYAEKIKPGKIYDAFCGSGAIAIYLADRFEEITGIDISLESIQAARVNAELNGIGNSVDFQLGSVEDLLPEELADDELIIFDPPRKGLPEETIELIKKNQVKNLIYVSCNPTTLARDLKKLAADYRIAELTAVDMFPQTYHVETVVLLERKI